jgi:outer membrane protein assembly factor BamB
VRQADRMAKRLRSLLEGGIFGFVIVAVSSVAFTGGPVSASSPQLSPWPTALHDSAHTSTASIQGPRHATVKWKRSLGGNITPGPVVAGDGTIYVATNAGVLHALDPITGADLWTFNGGSPYSGETDLSTSPLVLPSGSLLWPGPGDTLYELSASGHPQWSHQFSGSVLSPVRAGTRVYIELMTGSLWELNMQGGTPELGWDVTVGHISFGSPVVSPDGNIITTADKSVIAVADRGSSGVVRWRHVATATIEVSPSVASNGDVFVTANDGTAYAIKAGGLLRWKRHIGQESYSSSSVSANGLLYFGDNGGVLHIVRTTTGAEIHRDHGYKGIWGAQAIDSRGNVYFGTQGGDIYGYSGAGRQLFQLKASGPIDSYPALTGSGVLLIGAESGTLYAIG